VVFLSSGPAWAAERVIRLEEALRLALEHDEAIVIQRERWPPRRRRRGRGGRVRPALLGGGGVAEGRLP